MTQGQPGLRERKKLQTRRKLMRVAVELFEERGYDKVSVAEIAAAAEVSKMTVFNYCGSKEDILVGALEDHVGDVARAVRERAPGESVVHAVRRQFLAAVDAFEPAVGMSDEPFVLRMRRLIIETPVLFARAREIAHRSERLLAEELAANVTPDDPELAHVIAGQLIGLRYSLVALNHRRLLAGEPAASFVDDAKALAERAFDSLEFGLGDYGAVRPDTAG
ncbi:TetR family transcriptional regulator [Streptomyces mobaraensis NBRC 13819 = DSM 40847]|uniref:TetR family transcriptional regulator n=2 Tax=Streptomyces mobaraensis TaxID=35621 RepID=A0A5N5WAK6_STRMB|nr:TetR/AcrR family transcriptional regulator [Streptomyces mobaraensis]EME98948.1 TetR family transcriptional regulator [Streptomyces mobaraensis NBRC 13819 = DSM 40847]KAB7848283.1 TetR family transcriptional regulator [Streptomyces mobaraensis]QTT74540.1 TetR family transcriptional regulator [Streptomyces mobaraensis NBRC 13819 = DSM 40847]